MHVSAKISFEIELHVEGDYVPGRPATPPSYASGGEPPDPEEINDLTITQIDGLKLISSKNGQRLHWDNVPLTKGVDMNSTDVQRLLENMLKFAGDDAEVALITEAHEQAVAEEEARQW